MQSLRILFEDDQILVIDKEAGVVVTPADTLQDETISDLLIREHGIMLDRGGIVHRLDKDTSGILIVAKTQKSLENLQLQFKERQVKKEYLALVHGKFEESRLVKGAIARNPGNREKFIVWDEEGKEAETLFKPISIYKLPDSRFEEVFGSMNKNQRRKLERSNYGEFSLLECYPATGRTHQIRVHLKYIGFPIVGDEKYGGRKTVRLDHRWCPRQFLHAKKLEITHPETGKRMVFESNLPEDLTGALDYLEVENKFKVVRN